MAVKSLAERCIVDSIRRGNYRKTRYNCGYTITNSNGVVQIHDEDSNVNQYEFFDNDFDCYFLYNLLVHIFESCVLTKQQKRWFVEQMLEIELEIPHFKFDATGEYVIIGVTEIFSRKDDINSDDIRLYRVCRSIIEKCGKTMDRDIEKDLISQQLKQIMV